MNRPPIKSTGAVGLLLWLRQDQPAVYRRLVSSVPEVANLDSALVEAETGGLGFFAEIASAARNALPKIKAALPKIMSTVVEVGGAVYLAKQQKDLIDAQVKQAQAGQAPLATAVVASPGNVSTVVVTRATVIPGVPDAVTYAGGALLALLLVKRLKLL